ncbi:23S rRNA m(2)G-2445 methyltransferase [Magnetococcus marinus MC-1]|uniref:Ribosomal RNA large subunit methyltransferase K/L n=1 Tax=Magnetococcus marinus (strain ATCC BAA-1437 / JCM 17883 / MC-1) TaxID=156889 RepID=RLMKL_MAGMM|nr:bifunctional 23S rRNA (guanine(2069)-N(7))-methyltransferase RlmK/23S rRNA (guanine(2445)-N(2))-methyltransferase RlmL [Magnetococcus marinus]A0L8B5.1 RecName: Full=Ribosomal RNA large subunit methyltransferase K/L; Includes: RecName: Full=23S rRNA m2G2445 methyltransferase; AltName: Full=rRNA (guanine-N(2)-)-methyltransferase RlmL; Includes: RecName: Full=23S rRNA m7G2069 methyltransferase; AltName: Full=rRNA (guanine-N(7)-)-methyltransferase RlmK [Magnetococcus marinus MC-1]ABK44208.1 23S rR
MYRYFATTARGLEPALAAELKRMGAKSVRPASAGVGFEGDLEIGLRACLWSRVATRIILSLKKIDVSTPEALYASVLEIPWEDHLDAEGTLSVDCIGTNDTIRHTNFGGQKLKDAVVDRIRDKKGSRPSVARERPDLRINLGIRGNEGRVGIDLSGEGLHRRGYRLRTGDAPLKENLAAALLYFAGWEEQARLGAPFVDPMCGSGTLPIEAAMMAGDIAPGSLRRYFGFRRWRGASGIAELWQRLADESIERQNQAKMPIIEAGDSDANMVHIAQANIEEAELEGHIRLHQRDVAAWQKGADWPDRPGVLVTNPPYGERLGEVVELKGLFAKLGMLLNGPLLGWRSGVLMGDVLWQSAMGLPQQGQRMDLNNGPIPCAYILHGTEPKPQAAKGAPAPKPGLQQGVVSPENAQMFANRLKKNQKRLKKWVTRENVRCYRLYDADMPEYALAVDRYEEWVVVQEYQAPSSIPDADAHRRLQDACSVLPEVLGVPPERVVVKQRKRQKGYNQYDKMANRGQKVLVAEQGLNFEVNLTDYLDTGLFPDHAPMRRRIQQEAANRRFLNLFCYTGTATVHAAAGGALTTTSVDLSNTYLEWAQRNMELNGFKGEHQHRFIKANCMQWIATTDQTFDLIFLDPPTFSNSKSMLESFDIQRDQVTLIGGVARLLNPDGVLYFSTNRKKFKLEQDLLSAQNLHMEEITQQTLDPDFHREPPIHRCWRITCA